MNRLSLRNNRLQFKTAGELLTILEELMEYNTPISWRKTGGCLTCNQLDLQTQGSQLVIMPKNIPNHRLPEFGITESVPSCKAKYPSLQGQPTLIL